MAKASKNATEGKEQLVRKEDVVTIYGTGEGFMEAGKAYSNIHKLAAEKLVEAGKATYDEPVDAKKGKKEPAAE